MPHSGWLWILVVYENSILFYLGELCWLKIMIIKKKKIYTYMYTPLNLRSHTNCWEGKRGPLFEILDSPLELVLKLIIC